MTKNWNNLTNIAVKRYDENYKEFATLEEALLHIGESEIEIMKDHVDFYYVVNSYYNQSAYILYADGIRIPVWKIKETYYNIPNEIRNFNRYYFKFRKRYNHKKHFRNGPVHGIHNSNWSGYQRSVKINSQRKVIDRNKTDNLDLVFEYGKRINVKLPEVLSGWDDEFRYSKNGDGWKNYRKNQYKVVEK